MNYICDNIINLFAFIILYLQKKKKIYSSVLNMVRGKSLNVVEDTRR